MSNPEVDDSSCVTPVQLSDSDMNAMDDENGKDKGTKQREKNQSLNQGNEPNFGKFSNVKMTNRV